MTNHVLGKLEASQISSHELERLREFINENTGSRLALLLRSIVVAAEDGITVNVFADDEEVTPNEAARLLKMSRPHLLTFMKDGDLPYHMVGTHKRIKMSDLVAFMEAREAGAKFVAEARYGKPKGSEADLPDDVLAQLNDL